MYSSLYYTYHVNNLARFQSKGIQHRLGIFFTICGVITSFDRPLRSSSEQFERSLLTLLLSILLL